MCAITASKCGNAAYIYNEFNTGLRAFDGGDITVETRRKIGIYSLEPTEMHPVWTGHWP
jgi:hypothetical protein